LINIALHRKNGIPGGQSTTIILVNKHDTEHAQGLVFSPYKTTL